MTSETETHPAGTPRPSKLGKIAARIGEAAVEGTIRAAKGVNAWARDPETHAAGKRLLDQGGRALSKGADLARAGATKALPAVGAASAKLGLGNGLSERAEQMRVRYDDYRREREMDELASTLDGLSDRQLAILGFDRCYLYTELEARADALAAREMAEDADEIPELDPAVPAPEQAELKPVPDQPEMAEPSSEASESPEVAEEQPTADDPKETTEPTDADRNAA